MKIDSMLFILAVADFERAVAFYDRVFEWPKKAEAPVYVEYEIAERYRLGLYKREGFALNTGVVPGSAPYGAITATEIYLRVDDPDALGDRLMEGGATLLSTLSLRSWGDEAAYYADPEGNVIAVAREAGA